MGWFQITNPDYSGIYRDSIKDDISRTIYKEYIERGNIKPGKYYYGPLKPEIYTVIQFPEETNKIPKRRRSSVPIDPFIKGGNWYYGHGLRYHRYLYKGESVYFFTDGKNYFGFVWAQKDGKRHFSTKEGETVEELQNRIMKYSNYTKNHEVLSYLTIYWTKEEYGKRNVYDIYGNGMRLRDDYYIEIDYTIKELYNLKRLAETHY